MRREQSRQREVTAAATVIDDYSLNRRASDQDRPELDALKRVDQGE